MSLDPAEIAAPIHDTHPDSPRGTGERARRQKTVPTSLYRPSSSPETMTAPPWFDRAMPAIQTRESPDRATRLWQVKRDSGAAGSRLPRQWHRADPPPARRVSQDPTRSRNVSRGPVSLPSKARPSCNPKRHARPRRSVRRRQRTTGVESRIRNPSAISPCLRPRGPHPDRPMHAPLALQRP